MTTPQTWLQAKLHSKGYQQVIGDILHHLPLDKLAGLVIADYVLTTEELKLLLARLSEKDEEIIEFVRQHTTPETLDQLCLELFNTFINEKSLHKSAWLLYCSGWLGSERIARHLIRNHMGFGNFQSTNWLMYTLEISNSQAARWYFLEKWLARSGWKIPDEALGRALQRQKSNLVDWTYSAIPLDRWTTTPIVQDGEAFHIQLAAEFTPYLIDPDGKRHSDPSALLGTAALQTWESSLSELRTVKTILSGLLEVYMIDEHRWTIAQWHKQFVEHHFFRYLCQSLVWGVYQADGTLCAAFRIAEDFTYSDHMDRLFKLPSDDALHIGIVHPIQLSAAEREQWQQIFMDYELIPPFSQMTRNVYELSEAEMAHPEHNIVRFWGQSALIVKQPQTIGISPLLGWYDNLNGMFSRVFPPQYTVRLNIRGTFRECFVLRNDEKMPLATVSPLVISELLYFATRLIR